MNSISYEFKRWVFGQLKKPIRKHIGQVEAKIPKINFLDKHLAGAQLLANRAELLKKMPSNAVVAELGVDNGDFSQQILELARPQKLHLIDLWSFPGYGEDKKNSVQSRFFGQIESGALQIHVGLTTEVVAQFADQYFDWLYVDSDHSYQVTAQELELYAPKVKAGGVMAGHDFVKGSVRGVRRYGVIEAVSEFCNKYNWKLIFLTMEVDNNPSFAIQKI